MNELQIIQQTIAEMQFAIAEIRRQSRDINNSPTNALDRARLTDIEKRLTALECSKGKAGGTIESSSQPFRNTREVLFIDSNGTPCCAGDTILCYDEGYKSFIEWVVMVESPTPKTTVGNWVLWKRAEK